MTQLQVIEQKVVDVAGSEILAAKTNDGKIFATVKWISQGIGLTEGQYQNQTRKIQDDLVISKGIANLKLPTNGGLQDVLCIELDFLPLWLAKISITPRMQKENPWTVKRLVEFQLKAKDVLADAFLNKPKTQLEMMQLQIEQMVKQEKEISELKNRTTVLESKQEDITNILSLSVRDWRNDVNKLINAIAMKLGGGQYFSEVRKESYKLLDEKAACDLNRRLENRKNKMAGRGCSKSTIEKINYLDIIEEDKKLISVYVTVIKELAIKYQVNPESYMQRKVAR